MAFLHARLKPGVDLVAEQAGLMTALEGADLVITGEGSMDGQSLRGKVPVGVARMARERGVPCIVLAGRLGVGYEAAHDLGITAAFSIAPGPASLETSLANAPNWLADRTEAVARTWMAASGRRI
jgi:glycerate kinase